jgi:hypothetical protein
MTPIGLAFPLIAALLAPVTTDANGVWPQSVKNNWDSPVQICIVKDGTTGANAADRLAPCASFVDPGASIVMSPALPAGVNSLTIRAVAMPTGGAPGLSPVSVDSRVVSRPAPPPLVPAPSLLP